MGAEDLDEFGGEEGKAEVVSLVDGAALPRGEVDEAVDEGGADVHHAEADDGEGSGEEEIRPEASEECCAHRVVGFDSRVRPLGDEEVVEPLRAVVR